MPKNTQLSELTVNAQADAMASLLDGGFVDVMDGLQPDSGDGEITNQRVLVTMTYGTPAFRRAAGGVISSNPIGPGVAVADGTPTWFRSYRADHRTAVFDGSAGKANANMILPSSRIVEGVTVGCSGIAHTVVKSNAAQAAQGLA